MKFSDLVDKTANLSCFRTRYLAAGENLAQIRLQLNRWKKEKKIVRLAKSVYSLNQPYIKIKPDIFAIAAALKSASYISMQSALSYYGLIPEHIYQHIGVTTGRGQEYNTPLLDIKFYHIPQRLFWGYRSLPLNTDNPIFMASAEKALLDLLYFTTGPIDFRFIEELRLQNIENLDCTVLKVYAQKFSSHRIETAADAFIHWINKEI